jgi:hypothetical protein
VAELRAAGEGVDRVLLLHDGTRSGSDLFQAVLTMLDPQVVLAIAPVSSEGTAPANGAGLVHEDQERARRLGRELSLVQLKENTGDAVVQLAQEGQYDLIILPVPSEPLPGQTSRLDARANYVLDRAHCRVFLAAPPRIPLETDR